MLLAESEMYRQTPVTRCRAPHLGHRLDFDNPSLRAPRRPGARHGRPHRRVLFRFTEARARARAHGPPKKNLLGKVIAGYRFARQVKPILDGFRRVRTPH